MAYRRTAIAAGCLLFALYLKLTLPDFGAAVVPALTRTLDVGQITVPPPEELFPWLRWD